VAARREQLDLYPASDLEGRSAAQCSLAEALIFSGDLPAAEAQIAAAEEVLGPEYRHVLMARAQLAAARHDWSTAQDCYARAERLLYPDDDPLGELRAILNLQKALLAVSERADEPSLKRLQQARKDLPPQLVEWRFREPWN
jgi:ATP/maltotriose-dependent transcriptional regulator MalT